MLTNIKQNIMKYLKLLSLLFILLFSMSVITSCSDDDEEILLHPDNVCNGHEFVDLGLSVKWATCNIAITSEKHGDYFAWGETSPRITSGWENYKWCNGTATSMTKYCHRSSDGTVDNKTVLELSDDVARVNWGGNWRMPTKAEFEELKDENNCTWEWTTQNEREGYKVTSKINGNSIFFPAAGYRFYGELRRYGKVGEYWSSSLSTKYSGYTSSSAYYLEFVSDRVISSYTDHRYQPKSVRAVCP